ncbi:MAG: ATP synthase F1 subunit delta [Clostridia bacterium]|nr:ATP synthase F1 subunit delta [Clostridia bacterium]
MQTVREYAEALYSLSCEENLKEDIAEEIASVRDVFKENPDYLKLLSSPSIEISERLGLLEAAFKDAVHEYVLSFLKLLCEKGHIAFYGECATEFEKLVAFSNKISKAKVTSAVELTDEEREALLEKLEIKCGHKVELETSVDSSLLGGVVIEQDGRIIDASLKRRLSEVKDVMAK